MMTISFSIRNLLLILVTCILIYIIYSAKTILIVAVFGMLLAYMLNPFVEFMIRRKIPRVAGTLIVVLIFALVFFCAGMWLIPKLYADIELFARRIPDYVAWFMRLLGDIGERLDIDLSNYSLYNRIMDQLRQSGSEILGWSSTIIGSVQYVVTVSLYITLIPMIAFFMLLDYPKFHDFLDKYVGADPEKGLRRYVALFSTVMSSYFRGQFTVMAILCVLYSIALSIVGLDMAILLGILTGLLSIVPYLGFVVGIVSSVVASLVQFQDIVHPLYVLLSYGIVQVMESFFITPKIVGESVGLHPVATIILLLVGGAVFGLLGMIFILPVSAIIFRIYKDMLDKKVVIQ